MNAVIALLLATQTPPPVTPAIPPVPTDISTLSSLPWRASPKISQDMSDFVASEVAAGRCGAAQALGSTSLLDVDLAVLARSDGGIRRVIPLAIDCPTVEQFAAGILTSLARGNLRQAEEGWYRARLSFSWSK